MCLISGCTGHNTNMIILNEQGKRITDVNELLERLTEAYYSQPDKIKKINDTMNKVFASLSF